MKKAGLLLFLAVFSLSIITHYVLAGSWDYLPGGDNYLNEDSFILDSGYVESFNPFIIKPNQDYILTVHDDYRRMFGPGEVLFEITFFKDSTQLSQIQIKSENFSGNPDLITYSYLFHSPLNSNKIKIRFLDLEDYYVTYGFSNMILEEGSIFDGFEDFIYGTIVDTSSPEFESVNEIISYVHSPISVAEIQSSLNAIDTIDGDVSSRITVISDNYTSNKTILGTYTIVFGVTDLSGNSNQVEIEVTVLDILKPEFSAMDPIHIPYGNSYSVNEIKQMLHASDNYDGDISTSITLVEDHYTSNSMIVGSYTMTFSVSDSSGNTASQTIVVNVVDEVAPIITGETSIVIGYDETITIPEILSNFSVTDNYDSSLSFVTVSDSYSANKYIIGSYAVQFSVTDSSGNTSYVTVEIDVVDEIGPIIYFDSRIVQTYSDTVLELDDFLHLLSITGEISSMESLNVRILYDSYSTHATIPGVYHLKLKIGNSEGDTIEKNFEIIVKEYSGYIYEPEIEEIPFLEKYKDYFIYGSLIAVIVGSNVVWFFVTKKR